MISSQALAQVPLFAGFSPDEQGALTASLRRRHYAKGEVIFHQGDPGSALFIIETGEVKISLPSPEGREIILALLRPGDFFGELALLDGKARSADAVAREPAQLLLLQREDFMRFLQSRPQAVVSLLAALSLRLRQTDQLIQDVAFLDVPTRLARALLYLGDTQGRPEDGKVIIASRLTQTDLADIIGATRESTNKWLRFYQRQGLISYHRGRVTLLKPQDLRRRLLL